MHCPFFRMRIDIVKKIHKRFQRLRLYIQHEHITRQRTVFQLIADCGIYSDAGLRTAAAHSQKSSDSAIGSV